MEINKRYSDSISEEDLNYHYYQKIIIVFVVHYAET